MKRLKMIRKAMIRNRYITIIMLFFPLCVFAQVNPQRGYILTNEGDTIRGTIDFRSETKNAQSCRFKADSTSEYRSYLPGEIRGYRLEGDGVFYVTRSFPVEGISKTFFAEYLLQGGISLYRYQEHTCDYFYLENQKGNVAELRDPEGNGNSRDVRERNYAEASKLLTEDLTTPLELASKPLSVPRLTKLIRQYDETYCQSDGECVQFQYDVKKVNTMAVHLLADVGYDFCRMEIAGYDKSYRLTSSQPFLSVGLDLSFPRYSKGLSFQALGFIGPWRGTGKARMKQGDVTEKFTCYGLQIGASYKFLADKSVNPFVHGGFKAMHFNEMEASYGELNDRGGEGVGFYVGAGLHIPLQHFGLRLSANYYYTQNSMDEHSIDFRGLAIQAGIIL